MHPKGSRKIRTILAASMIPAIAGFILVFAHLNRSATVRAYFCMEQTLVEHWPARLGKPAVERFAIMESVPTLCRFGILGPARIQVEPRMSFFLDPRDLVAVSILRGGEWQPEIWEALSPVLHGGAVFLDVGAHIGYFSIKAAVSMGNTGRVVAFEPNPETLKVLRDNVSANRAGNVIVEPIACTDREETLALYAGPGSNTGMSSLANENVPWDDAPPKRYAVRCRPIDDVVRELNLARVDAIKIDVEGAEVGVLRGAFHTLQRFHPTLVVEVVPEQLANFHHTVDDLNTIIREAGYTHGRPLDRTDWEWTAH